MAFSTSTTARWTILSSSAAIPSGRCRPSAFGMYTLRDGLARYAPAVHPGVQIPKVRLQVLPVVRPRHPVHPRRGLRADRPVRRPQPIDVDVVQQRGEPRFLVPSLPPRAHDPAHLSAPCPALCPGRVSLAVFPLAGPPSLHHLRRRRRGLVRRLRRYYADRPTSHARSSRAYRLGVPRTARPAITTGGRPWDLPVLAHEEIRTCPGSPTARGPPTARDNAASDVAFR